MALDPDITDVIDAIEYVDHDPINQRNTINAIIRALSSPERPDSLELADPRDGIPVLDETDIGTVVSAQRSAMIRLGLATEPK